MAAAAASSSSSSSLSIRRSLIYDVCLSFCPSGDERTFVDHLYDALKRKDIIVYKDDERIKKGKKISDDVIGCIKESKLSIIVLSKNYASSPWCLEELVKILECCKTTEHKAYPLFYHVEPTEIRKQIGQVGRAFAKLKEDLAAGKWRHALKEAGRLSGWTLSDTPHGVDALTILKIVQHISRDLRTAYPPPRSDNILIGMETRLKDLESFLAMGLNDVRMIGITGMGGSGKTTLARAIFDRVSSQFEGASFVENVRKASKTSLSGLMMLQKQVLSDILNDQGIKVTSVSDGGKKMKKMLCGSKVLLVLSNVDHINQLEALAGAPDWFMPGSRIIISTRNEQVLKAHGVYMIHNVSLLTDLEAESLFSWYAFGKDSPIHGYENLSTECVYFSAGLPLTIKVLGSFLCGKEKQEWIDALDMLKIIPEKETLKVLKLSYRGLNREVKEIFLDIACLMVGWEKDDAIRLLESSGFYARYGLRVLEQRYLITIDGDGVLGMHHHIEEMGKNIVRQTHPDEPYKHSRLWIREEIEDILANDLGTEATKAIAVDTPAKLNSEIVIKGFGSMKQLRLLHMVSEIDDFSRVKINKVGESFPDALQFLSWVGYPHCYLPNTFEANNLVALEMPYSRIVRLWERGERKVLYKLKFLNLSHSKLRDLDLELVPNLEGLRLEECHDLMKLHIPVQCRKLGSLELSHSKLRTINFRQTPNLEVLKIKECHHFENFKIPSICVMLRSVNLSHLKSKYLNLVSLPDLLTLHIKECHHLEHLRLPFSSKNLRSVKLRHLKLKFLEELVYTRNLETLHIEECHDLEVLRMPFDSVKLRTINLSHLKLKSLDVGGALNLETLHIEECHDMVQLIMHKKTFLNLTSLKLGHLNLMALDLGQTPNLKRLDLQDCKRLVHLYMPIGGFERLTFLNLSGCSRIESLLFIKELKTLEVLSLTRLYVKDFPDIIPEHSHSSLLELRFRYNDIEQLPPSIENLQKLVYLDLHSCRKLTSLPGSICRLRHLRNLKLYGCVIEKLPEDINKLESLEKLNLSFTCIKLLPESICKLKHLKTLNLSSCWNLEKLPERLGRIGCLQNLILTECTRLTQIPDSICKLNCLKYLSVMGCIQLEKLPEELGLSISLEELNLKDTLIRHLPRSISLLKDLKIYGPKSGLRYHDYASTSRTLEASSSKKQKPDPSKPPPQEDNE